MRPEKSRARVRKRAAGAASQATCLDGTKFDERKRGPPEGRLSQISLSGVAIEFGATVILEDVTLTVSRGDRWGIIGRNGTGKTSLLNVMAGRASPARGSVARASGLRVTVLDQHREFAASATVWVPCGNVRVSKPRNIRRSPWCSVPMRCSRARL